MRAMEDVLSYQEFRKYRDEVVQNFEKEGEELLRLDCMNPTKALSFLVEPYRANEVIEKSPDYLWARNMNISPEIREKNIVTSKGVRKFLSSIFHFLQNEEYETWLPMDIYPVYWDLALDRGLKPKSFPTFPKFDLDFLSQTSQYSAIVITNPLKSLGRVLNVEEVNRFIEWLKESPLRILIIDAVYLYGQGFDAGTWRLFETGQCIISHSLSKSWVEREVFGVSLVPEKWRNTLQAIQEVVTEKELVAFRLSEQPSLPKIQHRIFQKEWKRLAPTLLKIEEEWRIPSNGYFSLIPVSAEELLERHQILAIPASVYGSLEREYCFVSCLYYLKELYSS